MSQSGSGQSVSEDSTESQSGSTTTTNTKPKLDFGKKHRKVVRILTVVAYIISVSTAAVLLSAYYVFLWKPSPPEKRSSIDSPSTLALARQLPSNFHDDDDPESLYNSLDLFPPSSSFNDNEIEYTQPENHVNLKSPSFNYPQDSTPKSLITENIVTPTPVPPTPPLSLSSSSLLLSLSPSNIPPTTRRRLSTESLVLTNLSSSASTNNTRNFNLTENPEHILPVSSQNH